MDPERDDFADNDLTPRRLPLLTTLAVLGAVLAALCGGLIAFMFWASRQFDIPD